MTVTHIVLIEWKTDDPTRRESVQAAIGRLPEQIPEIQQLRLGESNSPEALEQGYDYGFVMSFETRADRDAYLSHPAHLPVAQLIGSSAKRVLVFDV
ncbi:Dabb family protein [Microbacterium atlanticum]|uniref:Dabb family protein n=1 Tax=Microbacterium atlanticum TaxID=2782168 RepID=UPI001889BCC8|nr:Dabb family protein [Microbacterium atlanticum]